MIEQREEHPEVGQRAQGSPRFDTYISVVGDLDRHNRFGKRRLVIDAESLKVFSEAEGRGPGVERKSLDLHVPVASIVRIATEVLVGCGAVVVRTDSGETIEAIRYTIGLEPQFAAAVKRIVAAIDGDPTAAEGEETGGRACAKCGADIAGEGLVCPKCVDGRAVLVRLINELEPYRWRSAMIVLLTVAGTVLTLLQPVFQQILTDDVLVPHRHLSWLGLIVLGAMGINALTVSLSIVRGRLIVWVSNHFIYSLRTKVYASLQQQSIGYYDSRQTGSLLARVTQDVNELQSFLSDSVQGFIINALQIIGIFVILLCYNWRLTLLVLLPLPFTVVVVAKTYQLLRGRQHRFYNIRSNLSGVVSAVLAGIRVVKAFGQERREEERFRERAEGLFHAGVAVEGSWATYSPVLSALTTIGVYIIWYYGGLQVFANRSNSHTHGLMTIGVLALFLSYVWWIIAPMQFLTRTAEWLSRAIASSERIFEVLDAKPAVTNSLRATSPASLTGKVEFKDVYFGYAERHDVLHGVSIAVDAGESIGIVGHSGAGKSTLINLLLRFYDVRAGAIHIDGIDIRDIDLAELRRRIAIVPQDPFLFPCTIAENIAYGLPEAMPRRIVEAATAASAHDFVMRLDDAYDTNAGERGVRLSGGERQRISIARAVLNDPPILLLDEATAAVDSATEKDIQEALDRLTRGRTTFTIAHRLTTVQNANRLMVMKLGRLVEVGTYQDLKARHGSVFNSLLQSSADGPATSGDTQDDPAAGQPHEAGNVETSAIRLVCANGPGRRVGLTMHGKRWDGVRVLRAFPITNPAACICIQDEFGKSLALIPNLDDLDADSRMVAALELERRYFTPIVKRVARVVERGHSITWQVETDRGPRDFVVHDIRDNGYPVGPGAVMLSDTDKNRYFFPDVAGLSISAYEVLARVL